MLGFSFSRIKYIYKMTGEGSKLSKREGKVRVSVNLITIKYEQNERYWTFNYKLLKLKLRACKHVVVMFLPV